MTTLPLIQDCVLIIAGDTVGFEFTGDGILMNCLTDAATTIDVASGVTAYVLDDQGMTYSGSGTVEPLEGDRAVWDALAYQDRHANDIDDPAGIHQTIAYLDTIYAPIVPLTIWVPLSNGDPTTPSLIFDAEGAVIMVEVDL